MRDTLRELVPESRTSRSRRRHLRLAAVLACVALVVAVGLITSRLIREPPRADVSVIELTSPPATPAPTPTPRPARKRRPAATRTPTPAPTAAPGGFAPPQSDADADADDPFDDEPDEPDDDGD